MPSLGTWEPEAADLWAKVLTNGFETCLLRPRDQPLAEGKFPACLCFGGLLPPSLSSPPPSELGCGLGGCGMARGSMGRAQV